MTRIALVSTSDTDLLSARASGADYVYVNPTKAAHAEMAEVFAAADLIVARILGSAQSLCSGFARIRAEGQPMVVLGGEQAPDASLMELSTVPIGIAADAHVYLAQGGPENLAQLHAFLSDTVLLTGEGFEPPVAQPVWGELAAHRARPASTRSAPASASSSTARSRRPGTPPTCTPWPTPSTPPVGSGCRSSPPPCATPPPTCSRTSAPSTPWSPPCSPPAGPGRPRRRPVRTTAPGTSRPWRPWTSRSCRGSVSPPRGRSGRSRTRA